MEEIIIISYGIKDRVAVITGTNNTCGIGAAAAYKFACFVDYFVFDYFSKLKN